MAIPTAKACTRCGKEKALTDFSPDPRGKFGRYCHCKECRNVYINQYNKQNRERRAGPIKDWLKQRQEYWSAWEAQNPDARKECAQCKALLPLRDFYPNPGCVYGRESICRQCKLAYWRDWNARPDVKAERSLRSKEDEKGYAPQRKIQRAEYYERNREVLSTRHKEWYQANKDYFRVAKLKRRALEANVPHTLTEKDGQVILSMGCFICGSKERLELGHDVPVVKGGGFTFGNIVCLCRTCNGHVGTRILYQMLHQPPLSGLQYG